MKPEERFNLEVFVLLKDIKRELLYTSSKASKKLYYIIRSEKKDDINEGLKLNEGLQRKILYKLEELGALKLEIIENDLFPVEFNVPNSSKKYQLAPVQFYLHINQQKFDVVYEQFSSEVAKYRSASVVSVKTSSNDEKTKVRLIKDKLNLYLQTPEERINLKRLRTDLIPDKLLTYLLIQHPNEVVSVAQLKLEGAGYGATRDIGEKLRKAGFTQKIKQYFVPVCDKERVQILNEAEINRSDLEAIKAEIQLKK